MKHSLFKPVLLRWQLRQLLPVNAPMAVAATWYLLTRAEPLTAPGDWWMLLVVMAHSALVVWLLGRGTSRHAAFLYAQGYSRDQMWAQSMLASACSALCVCLPAAILIFSGLRSSVQDAFDNPWFPLMQTDEYWLPAVLSLEYATVMLLMHYSWLRANQSCSDSSAGWMLMCLGLCFLLWGFGLADSHSYHPSFLTYVPRLLTPAVVLLLVAGFRLHRSLEIRS